LEDDLRGLLAIRGIGKGKLAHVEKALGGPGSLREALEEGNVSLLSSLEGISERMAVDMVLRHRGEHRLELLASVASAEVFSSIQEELRGYMHTEAARNRISLSVPRMDLEEMAARARLVYDHSLLVEGTDRRRVEGLLSGLKRRASGRARRTRFPYVLVAEDDAALSSIEEMGLDRSCLVLSPEEVDPSVEGQLIYVYGSRTLDEVDLPVIASVSHDSPACRIVPEVMLDRYREERERIESLSMLESEFDHPGKAGRFLDLLNDLAGMEKAGRTPDAVRSAVEEIASELNRFLKERISSLTLSGSDALSLLEEDDPPEISSIYSECAVLASRYCRERLGCVLDVFRIRYPVSVDREALEGHIRRISDEEEGSRFGRKADIATELSSLEEDLEREFYWGEDLDLRYSLGCFVIDHGLNPFQVVEGFFGFREGCDLFLRGGNHQPVTYHLGAVPDPVFGDFPRSSLSDARISLLTGANSGGKTTLLRTIAQIVIMAHMGLPVPAAQAHVPGLKKLYLYKPGKHLDAGGLEGFLRDLLPLSLEASEGTMMLADELEAMTELEAASRIIGGFAGELKERGSYGVIVTHMAGDIGRYAELRVDGIEAKGLSESHELIVDRTPRIGHIARSTPELILRRLSARSKGEERELYDRILDKF